MPLAVADCVDFVGTESGMKKLMGFIVVGLLLVLVLAACWKMYQDDKRRKAEGRAKQMESMPMDAWPDPGLAFVPGAGGGGAQRRGVGGGGGGDTMPF